MIPLLRVTSPLSPPTRPSMSRVGLSVYLYMQPLRRPSMRICYVRATPLQSQKRCSWHLRPDETGHGRFERGNRSFHAPSQGSRLSYVFLSYEDCQHTFVSSTRATLCVRDDTATAGAPLEDADASSPAPLALEAACRSPRCGVATAAPGLRPCRGLHRPFWALRGLKRRSCHQRLARAGRSTRRPTGGRTTSTRRRA